MASTRSNISFSIAEFASLVESALDIDHELDISIHLPPPSPTLSRISCAPSRRHTSTTNVLSKFRQFVSPPRPRFERAESPTAPIPTVSLMAPGPMDVVPFLPLASRHELEAKASAGSFRTESVFSAEFCSVQSSPTTPTFPLTPTYSDSVCSSAEVASITASEQLDDPFAKGSVQIVSATPPKSASISRPRTRPPPLNIYAPPSCPLPSPPATPSPSRTSSNSSASYRRHPYANADWNLDLPVTQYVDCQPPNPLSPRHRGTHKRAGSPFPLSLTLHDRVPSPVPIECERNWMDMSDSDEEEEEEEDMDGMETPVRHMPRRCRSDSELRTPVQLVFPLALLQRHCVDDEDDDAQTAYYSARSSFCSQIWYVFPFPPISY